MNIPMSMPKDALDMISGNAMVNGRGFSNGRDFLNLLTSLLAKGSEGEDMLISLFRNGTLDESNSNVSLMDSLGVLGEGSKTVESLLKVLNLKINGEETSFKKENFIIDNSAIEDVLSNIKSLTKNGSEESLSQYINGVNEENGFLQLKAMQSLNLQAQNSNIASTLQGMVLNYSNNAENKEVINALKFLQQFTTEDGGLDTSKLIKALEGKTKGQDGSMGNMNFMQGHSSEVNNNIITKEVNIFRNKDVVDVVVENFKTLRLPGRCEMKIVLNPKELGEITIKLVLEKGQINAVVSANKKDTVALLQNNLNNLMNQMKESGTEIQHIAINLTQDQSGEEARRGYKEQEKQQEDNEFENIFEDISEEEEFINSLI